MGSHIHSCQSLLLSCLIVGIDMNVRIWPSISKNNLTIAFFSNTGHLYIYLLVSQQKQHAIVGSALTQNNIRHYINSMLLRISEIIQLGYPLINAVGHFMDRLDTKHTRLYIKHTRVDVFCSTTAPYTPPFQSPFIGSPFSLFACNWLNASTIIHTYNSNTT